MNFLRNLFGVVLGLVVSLAIVGWGIVLNDQWVKYDINKRFPYDHWRYVIKYASDWFFVGLMISAGIASIIGGIITALIVREAKQAYAMLIGFILMIAAALDVIFTPYHPTWYDAIFWVVYFPFSWFGGKLVTLIHRTK